MKANRNTSATQRFVPSGAAMTANELSFTSRDSDGLRWWSVPEIKTPYPHAHEALGRSLAFEMLDYLRNPAAERDPDAIGHVVLAVVGEPRDICRAARCFWRFSGRSADTCLVT